MNKTELVAAVAEKAGLKKEDAAKAVNAVFEAISDALIEGEKVQLVGFGSFQVKERAEKQAKNPRTGEKITVPATKRPSFTAGKVLKDAVASK